MAMKLAMMVNTQFRNGYTFGIQFEKDALVTRHKGRPGQFQNGLIGQEAQNIIERCLRDRRRSLQMRAQFI